MVVPRKWKMVAGAMSATVALGATAAVAQEGEGSSDGDVQSVLTEVVNIDTLSQVENGDKTETTMVEDATLIEDESPFDSVAEDSISVESVSVPSADSLSVESESLPSADSASVESESLPSADSISADSSD